MCIETKISHTKVKFTTVSSQQGNRVISYHQPRDGCHKLALTGQMVPQTETFATKCDDPSLIPRTHIVERENQVLLIVT